MVCSAAEGAEYGDFFNMGMIDGFEGEFQVCLVLVSGKTLLRDSAEGFENMRQGRVEIPYNEVGPEAHFIAMVCSTIGSNEDRVFLDFFFDKVGGGNRRCENDGNACVCKHHLPMKKL